MKTIAEILTSIRPEYNFDGSADFIADGMLDSFDVVTLVSEIENEYGISIVGTDILPEHFTNLSSIRAILKKYGVNQ